MGGRAILSLLRSAVLAAALLPTCTMLTGCGGSMKPSGNSGNSAPVISTISPTSLPAGSGSFTLQLTGHGFSAASTVHFGSDIFSPTTMPASCASPNNCPTMQVSIPSKDVVTMGSVNVFVSNSSLTSNTVVFAVKASSPSNAPQILAFLPTLAPAGGPAFSMAILAANVAPNALVNFGGQQLTPTSLLNCGSGQICPKIVQIPASAIASAGQVQLSMTNPGSNGGTFERGTVSRPGQDCVSN